MINGDYFYYLIVLIGSGVFSISLIGALRKPFFKLCVTAVKQLDILLDSQLDDDSKDRLIFRNLFSLIFELLKNLLFLGGCIILGLVPFFVFDLIFNPEQVDTNSFFFYTSMIVGSCVVLIPMQKKVSYSYWSKLLHSIVLNNYNLGKFMLQIELKKVEKVEEPSRSNFIIVTGLARAGTTALTNLLYSPKIFHSISYSNVPFLLAPRIWKMIYNPKKVRYSERAHGDQVLFSENSIEALEEYFFKTKLNDSYITTNSVGKHKVSEQVFSEYLLYQELFRQADNTTYLAKNNNFMLRYESFRKFNSCFEIVLMFRNPFDHAWSLKSQHDNFITQQSEDSFVLDYMNWMGHYEFGKNHKYFEFDENFESQRFGKESIEYWLLIWINYYKYVLKHEDSQMFFVHYEDLLKFPNKLKKELDKVLKKGLSDEPIEKFVPKAKMSKQANVNEEVLSRANSLYSQLLDRSIKV